MIRLPNLNNKNWQTSYQGDYLGQIILNLGIDLFSDYGKVKIGGKFYPHTIGDLSSEPLKAIACFTTANISDGAEHPTKIWGVSDDNMIIRGDGEEQFVKDESDGFTATEDTGSGSDLVSVADETDEPLTVTELIIPVGDGAVSIMGSGDNTKWAQSFTKIQGPFKKLSLYIRKAGTPTDNVIVELQTDNAGVPSGTVLTSLTLNAEQFGSSFVLYEYENDEFTTPDIDFELDETYHLVLRRSGAADEDNYVMFQIAFAERNEDMEDDDEANPYKNGELQQYNGTAWTRTIVCKKTDTFTSDGSWVVPAGITEALVECWAAGAGGTENVGGGGGGGYSRSLLSLTPTDSHLVMVGEGGDSDQDGGKSSFGGVEAELLIVGGGGAGGGASGSSSRTGGGGGGGQVRELTPAILVADYDVVIGAGGDGDVDPATSGGDSAFDSFIAKGGSFGGRGGNNGGSGIVGGGGGVNATGGAGSVSRGGNGFVPVNPVDNAGGGGGGAGGNGVDATIAAGGAGGVGITSSISGAAVVYGAGGGGAGVSTKGAAGGAGAGAGGNSTSAPGGDGTANTGGGGGGGYTSGSANVGGDGGSGVVIIRYPTGSITATGGTITTDGGDTIHTFTSDGTFSVSAVTASEQVLAQGGKSGGNGGTGGQAADGIGDVKYSGGGGSLGSDADGNGGGGGAGDEADGGTTGSEIGGTGGGRQGGSGGGNLNGDIVNNGGMYGGGGRSTTSSGQEGARGEVRITYNVTLPVDYPIVAERVFGNNSVATGSHYVEVPKSTLPGDLLIVVIATSQNNLGATFSGWTKLKEAKDFFNDCTQFVFYKRATGDDNGYVQVTNNSGSTYVCYRIINGDVPTATQAVMAGPADPPEHDTFKLAKYLWIIGGSGNNGGFPTNNPTAAPANYSSFIIQPPKYWWEDQDLIAPMTFTADRLLEAASEDPDPFTGSVANAEIAVTIAVPYKEQEQFMDLSMSLQVEYPAATERLYLTTTEDLKFLNEEDGTWQSLWQGVFQQDALDPEYPHPLKLLSAGGVLLFGDKNKLHSCIATGVSPSDARPSRVVFDPNYFINWIEYTKSEVFIGLQHVSGDTLPSLVVQYQPFTEITRIFTIEEGATVGFVVNENCHIIDKAGQIRAYNGSAFPAYDYFPPYWTGDKITLPHRNGIIVVNDQYYCLWEGQYPYPAGVWAYENKRLYHKHGLVFDPEVLNSLAAIETPSGLRALYDTGSDILAGALVYGSDNAEVVEGVFSKNKATGVDVDSYSRASFVTPRFPSVDVNTIWQRIFGKVDHLGTGPSGELVLKYRQESAQVAEGKFADSFAGEWTSDTEFTCDDADFVDAVDDGFIAVGDEVIVRRGQGAGLNLQITDITGTTTKTVTVTNGLSAISSGDFSFSVENWKYIQNRDLTAQNNEWLQVKAEIQDNVALEEIQVTSKTNETNNE